jgi:hypothetical protein
MPLIRSGDLLPEGPLSGFTTETNHEQSHNEGRSPLADREYILRTRATIGRKTSPLLLPYLEPFCQSNWFEGVVRTLADLGQP